MSVSTEHAWQALSRQLRAFFRRRVRDDQLAEDLLQETFMRVHNGLASLRKQERLAAWVYRIAHNTLKDYFRTGSVSKEVLAPDGVVADAIPEENTAEENYNKEIAAGLGCIVQQLSPRYREAIELTELQGLTQSEVGARLGLSLSGAKSRVQRGRAKLKDLLLECCHFELDRHGNVIDYRPQHACSGCGENPTTAQASPITTSQSDSCCG